MTAGDAAQQQLYDRLVETLGEEPAMTLTDRLRPPGEELATRADTGRLEDRMDRLEDRMDRLEDRMDRLEDRMDRLEDRMDGFNDRMDGFNGRMDGLHTAIREQTNELHTAIAEQGRELHEALDRQGRNFTLALVGSYASLAGAAIGVAALI